jgi:hypothetical protein
MDPLDTTTAATDIALSDETLRGLLDQYADAYSDQKAAERQADAAKKRCATIAKQLEPFFDRDKTLVSSRIQVTRSAPESYRWDTDRAVGEKPALGAMLAPYRTITYDVKKAIDEVPALAGLLADYRSKVTGTPRITATLKAQP